MPDEKPMALSQAVEQVVTQLNAHTTLDEFTQRILAIRPSQAKKPSAAMHDHLRCHTGIDIVFLDRQTIVPLRLAMQGVRFRLRLTRPEIDFGVLLTQPGFDPFLRRAIALQDAQLVDAAGQPLPVCPVAVTFETTAAVAFAPSTFDVAALDLGDWFRAQQIQAGDSILVTIEDWEKGHFRLEHEPASQRRQPEIERQNQELANLLFDLLEADRRERLYVYQAIPTVYARLSDPRGYPGDHWTAVIARDARMQWDGIDINYREGSPSLMEELLFLDEEEAAQPEKPHNPAQQVYRFKAILAHRPGRWRQIEIEGQQTMADFDAILRDAFNHDPSDHLGGFWRRVRRGKTQRFREVDLAEIDPLGEGDGADQTVAELALQPGDELKYVYDFGDWIEHQITLEAIVAPEAGAAYPRIVGQSQTRHRYCQSCQAAGRKTVATWICVDCSEEQQRDVLLCEDCLEAQHEDHYAEELLY